MIAAIHHTQYDVARVLLITAMCLLAGGMIRVYIRIYLTRRSSTMLWGSLSAMCFIGGAIAEEFSRFGDDAESWRFFVFFAGTVFGLVAVYQHWRPKAR